MPMIAAPPRSPDYSVCLAPPPKTYGGTDDRVAALLSEAKVFPLRVLEPGDEFLPQSMPDRFKPQLVVMDAQLDQDGRVSACDVRKPSSFAVLNTASCDLIRRHYVAARPLASRTSKIAVDWTNHSTDPERKKCYEQNGTVPITSSLWITSEVFKGAGLETGVALIALDVGTQGYADRCVVLAASVSAALQRNVCKMAVQRATVLPAVDDQGRLVPARMTMVVRLKGR